MNLSDKNFIKLIDNQLNFNEAVFLNEISIDGNKALAMKFKEFLKKIPILKPKL